MTNMAVASEIARQMGGTRRLGLMVGAKNFTASENALTFSIGKGAKQKINKVRITLTEDDLYDVEFMRIWGTKVTVIDKTEGVYNDMLVDLFENATGFYLSL